MALRRDGRSFGVCFRLGDRHSQARVGLHFPAVGGMGFAHVNSQKYSLFTEPFVDLLDAWEHRAERTTREIAKRQDHRFLANNFTQSDRLRTVESFQCEVRRLFVDFRTFIQRPQLAGEQPANQDVLRWSVARQERAGKSREQRVAQVFGDQMVFASAGSVEKGDPFFASQLAVAVGFHAAEQAGDQVGLLYPRVTVGPVEVVGRNAAILVAIQPRNPVRRHWQLVDRNRLGIHAGSLS